MTKRILRGASVLLASAAAFAAFPATSASAAEYCFGAPSVPVTYACYTPDTQSGAGAGTEQETYTVPSVCYGVGCTADRPVVVDVPYVYYAEETDLGTVTHNGETYRLTVQVSCLGQEFSEIVNQLVRCYGS